MRLALLMLILGSVIASCQERPRGHSYITVCNWERTECEITVFGLPDHMNQ